MQKGQQFLQQMPVSRWQYHDKVAKKLNFNLEIFNFIQLQKSAVHLAMKKRLRQISKKPFQHTSNIVNIVLTEVNFKIIDGGFLRSIRGCILRNLKMRISSFLTIHQIYSLEGLFQSIHSLHTASNSKDTINMKPLLQDVINTANDNVRNGGNAQTRRVITLR